MFIAFNTSHIADLFYHASEPACIGHALADLQRDLQKVSGKTAEIKPYLPRAERGYILAGSLETPAFREHLAALEIDISELHDRWEGCLVRSFGLDDENLLICGTDRRGSMWGIYDFCERYLGVDPLYFWTDHEPAHLETLQLAAFSRIEAPKTFTYRGVFINDEDLLTDWKDNGGKRTTNYPFYHQVVHPSILHRVVETVLRLKMNLIIPASLLDIDNPPEENLVRLVTERGLYVSQHHIEPLGVSHFAWDNYWQKQGEVVEPSYVRHPEKFEQIWRYYAKKWSQYPGVIWQFGLRGRGDRPVWFNDSSVPAAVEARGQLISAAYAKQAQIVAETLGSTDYVSTATLWMEGSELQRLGVLNIPRHTLVIFSDFGSTQMMLDDFYETRRDPARGYGVYHHVAFWGDGPHLVQGTALEKLAFNYKNAVERGDTAYSILNVCNMREFALGIEAVARMNWDASASSPMLHAPAGEPRRFDAPAGGQEGSTFDLNQFRRNWFERQFGTAAVPALEVLYQKFYGAYIALDNTRFPGEMLLLDGIARIIGLMLVNYTPETFNKPDFVNNRFYTQFQTVEQLLAYFIPAFSSGLEQWQAAYDAAWRAYSLVTPERQSFLVDHFIVQIEIMLGLYGWGYNLCLATRARLAGDAQGWQTHVKKAVFALEKLLVDRTKAEHGKWQGWYRGDKKMNLPGVLEKTRELLT